MLLAGDGEDPKRQVRCGVGWFACTKLPVSPRCLSPFWNSCIVEGLVWDMTGVTDMTIFCLKLLKSVTSTIFVWLFYFTGPMVVPTLFTLRFALNAALLHTLIWEEWVCIQYCSKMRARVCNSLLYAYCQLFLMIPASFNENYFMNYLTYNTEGYR